mmetsp:Transcript_8193/g.30291  ORF Transcript_8193/g.30291 Transcript_8193/m.30291 type:complete len:347 (-) Transcript_8193:121-1161(-)|eukprot:CAMPEP_0117450720 /NCGR_PEP_ID=MMETSP0759-20121206/8620_1 /TAXON_ID=63605 /ORGANISM="Percolomonas cosmopolitus, Strain WS" /LENGTH=346 /DNA_ID=CAMNT_0005243263 /DNA_START=240 /DNA_END=1280 /DNA_ORIENTATION=+
MRKYKVTKLLGEGSFASVYEAINTETNSIVAIKQLKKKYFSWSECIKLREVESLRKLNHLNIVKLKEVVRENNVLYLVFEHMSQNLYQLLQDETKMSESMIRSLIYQVLQGLKYLHQNGYFHRDMKPENILIQSGVAKLADFGLAKYIRSKPPFTEYVSTRWYRSMEVTLSGGHYNSPIDVWAMGAIMAELYTGRPLFPGKNTMDQIVKICKVRGSPTNENWAEGLKIASQRGFQFPKFDPQSLKELIPNASPEALDLIDQMLQVDPRKRPTAAAALNHRFFKVGIIKPLVFKTSTSQKSSRASSRKFTSDALFEDNTFRGSLESTGGPSTGEEDSLGRSLYSFPT